MVDAVLPARDHRAHLAKVHDVAVTEDIGYQPMAFDPEGMRMRQMLANLRTMAAGTNWDAAFLRFQAQHHQNEIDLFSATIKNAHDDDLEVPAARDRRMAEGRRVSTAQCFGGFFIFNTQLTGDSALTERGFVVFEQGEN